MRTSENSRWANQAGYARTFLSCGSNPTVLGYYTLLASQVLSERERAPSQRFGPSSDPRRFASAVGRGQVITRPAPRAKPPFGRNSSSAFIRGAMLPDVMYRVS
jgi:hypothetical protein